MLLSRVVGFVGSLTLTAIAFWIFFFPGALGLSTQANVWIVCILALMQCSVQSIFFLNVLSERGTRWHLIIFASTLSIIAIIVVGSIWIMQHLNDNMMH